MVQLSHATLAPTSSAAVPAAPQPVLRARCPIDFSPRGGSPDGVHGMKRVSRHPVFWSLAAVGLGSALTTPYVTHVVMFGVRALSVTALKVVRLKALLGSLFGVGLGHGAFWHDS